MARMGRPKKLAKERQSHLIALRLNPAEHKKLEQVARKSSKTNLSRVGYIEKKKKKKKKQRNCYEPRLLVRLWYA